jgi:hypothetical protein
MIDNYEVYEALPPQLQAIALERDRQQTKDILARDHELAAAFAESRARLYAKYEHVMKGGSVAYQG